MLAWLPPITTKRGFKVLVRADSSNGFVCDLDVYTGKDGVVTTNLSTNVVERLSRALVGGHYHLYFDNYFSSLPLFDSLLEDGLYACSRFRKDRKGTPTDIVWEVCTGSACKRNMLLPALNCSFLSFSTSTTLHVDLLSANVNNLLFCFGGLTLGLRNKSYSSLDSNSA